jgi:hypothetical protein
MEEIWYHGSPLCLTTLLKGSTITHSRHLAEVFSHKPSIVSIADDGSIKHSGTLPGYLYRIAEHVAHGDVYPHPHSSMGPGLEWLTRRELRLALIGPTTVRDGEQLTEEDLTELRRLEQEQAGG